MLQEKLLAAGKIPASRPLESPDGINLRRPLYVRRIRAGRVIIWKS